MKTTSGIIAKYFRWFVPSASVLQSLLLLVIRLYWGWEFFLTGKGKLMDLRKPTEFFQSLDTTGCRHNLIAYVIQDTGQRNSDVLFVIHYKYCF